MIQNKNFTYNGLLNILNSFAEAHIDIRRFVGEDEDQMSEMTSKEELFPMMFVAPINNIYDWHINQYEIRVYVYDRILKDRSNINDIRSKTNQILNDLDVWLRKESDLPIEITNISIAYPFLSELMTDVTGWYFDVVIDIPSYETCKIPFISTPIITGFTCDVQYTNQFITCDTLEDCPVIQDIQNELSKTKGVGVMYLKNNTTPTPITAINQRKVVVGNMETGMLDKFIKDPLTNSLKYIGDGGRFHIITSFNFYEGNQNTCGFYIGHNTDDTTSLDPDGDRISESEIYANSGNPSSQPIAATIQTVLELNTNDRIFFIVQNRDAASDITVEFMKLIATEI
jgi:hypothetical protein